MLAFGHRTLGPEPLPPAAQAKVAGRGPGPPREEGRHGGDQESAQACGGIAMTGAEGRREEVGPLGANASRE